MLLNAAAGLLQIVGLPSHTTREHILDGLAKVLFGDMPSVHVFPAEVLDSPCGPVFVLRFDDLKAMKLLEAKALVVDVPLKDHCVFESHDQLATTSVRCVIEPMTSFAQQRYVEAHEMIQRKRTQRKEQRRRYKQSRKQHKSKHKVLLKRTGRTSLDDVLRLSRGQGTRSKTGSREVPHRLNADERKRFQLARDHGFLVVRGSGYRTERKGSPLCNLHRQLCDATSAVVLRIEQGSAITVLCVDLSTLRMPSDSLQGLQARYEGFVRDFVLDHGMHEAMIEITPIDGGAHAGYDRDDDGEAGGYLQQPIWRIAPVGFLVAMETRTDTRLVAHALSSLDVMELPAEEGHAAEQVIGSEDISDFF
jgi:hypothetical protein